MGYDILLWYSVSDDCPWAMVKMLARSRVSMAALCVGLVVIASLFLSVMNKNYIQWNYIQRNYKSDDSCIKRNVNLTAIKIECLTEILSNFITLSLILSY